MDIAIIGTGISGISAGKILQDKGHCVTLFEKASKVGGLVRCDDVNGHLFHRTGGHVFNAKDTIVNDWFWKHFAKENEFIQAKRNAKIWLGRKLIGYPIENFLYQLDKPTIKNVLSDIFKLQSQGYKDPLSYPNFSSFLEGNFGSTLYQLYFKPYNEKIWHCDLEQVPLAWLEGKLPMPNYLDMMLNNIVKEEEGGMVHSSFYYPKSGGSQFIVNRLSEGLTIQFNAEINKIERRNSQWQINGADFDQVVFTGDVRTLFSVLSTDDSLLQNALKDITDLKSNGTSNVLCETDPINLSWLYLPDQDLMAHRIIYTGNFSPSNNAVGHRRSCVVEFSGKQEESRMRTEVHKLPGNLKPIAFNYEPNSYIIQDHQTREKIKQLKSRLDTYGFYLNGRFAEWEYYNMDKAIFSSLNQFS